MLKPQNGLKFREVLVLGVSPYSGKSIFVKALAEEIIKKEKDEVRRKSTEAKYRDKEIR